MITSKFVPKFEKEFLAMFIVNWTRRKMGKGWTTIFKSYEIQDAVEIVNYSGLKSIFDKCVVYDNSNSITQWYMRIFHRMGSKYLTDLTKFGKSIFA